jgi:hypothetical protein
MSHDVPFSRKESARDWAAIRGEVSIYVLAAVVGVFALFAYDLTQAVREDIAEKKRLNDRLNADTRFIQMVLKQVDPERQPWTPVDNPRTP